MLILYGLMQLKVFRNEMNYFQCITFKNTISCLKWNRNFHGIEQS